MHDAAYQFVEKVVADLDMKRKHVLEFGSFDVNGSVRPLFAEAASYTGIDVRPGRGVDVVSRAQDYTPERLAHIVVSTEVLEHDPDPRGQIAAAFRCLRPGGTVICTAAAPKRPPHGNDGGPLPAHEHYATIDPAELRSWLKEAGFTQVNVTHNEAANDVYAVATKPDSAEAESPPATPKTTKKEA